MIILLKKCLKFEIFVCSIMQIIASTFAHDFNFVHVTALTSQIDKSDDMRNRPEVTILLRLFN